MQVKPTINDHELIPEQEMYQSPSKRSLSSLDSVFESPTKRRRLTYTSFSPVFPFPTPSPRRRTTSTPNVQLTDFPEIDVLRQDLTPSNQNPSRRPFSMRIQSAENQASKTRVPLSSFTNNDDNESSATDIVDEDDSASKLSKEDDESQDQNMSDGEDEEEEEEEDEDSEESEDENEEEDLRKSPFSNDNEDDNERRDSLRLKVDSSTQTTVKRRRLDISRQHRILLDTRRVGGVIGKKGCVINNIRKTSSATMLIAAPIPNSQFRVCTLRGTFKQTSTAIKLIIDKMAEETCRSPPFQITIMVEEKNIGYLIGRKGSAISGIRALTNANIYISGSTLRQSTEKTVDISGDRQSVHRAVDLVVERLYHNPMYTDTRKCYDPKVDCPQSNNGNNSRGSILRMSSPPAYSQLIQPQLIVTPSNPHPQCGSDALRKSPSPSPSPGFNFHGNAHSPSPLTNATPFINATPCGNGQFVYVMPIMSQFIGRIIGRDGRTIRRIRRQSNADINISKPLPPRTERYITILGTAQQISAAVCMIVNCISS